MSPTETSIHTAYELARERYAALGVDTDAALAALDQVAISLHCWQGDDVGGFESPGGELGGGIAATGNYPGKARNADELRRDLDVAYSLMPGSHRLNLHAIYLEADDAGGAERHRAAPFRRLAGLGQGQRPRPGLQPDLLLPPPGRRRLHPQPPRRGRAPVLDRALHRLPPDRRCTSARRWARRASPTSGFPTATRTRRPTAATPRRLLRDSLDAVLAENIDPRYNLDAVEPKLFGIGLGKLRDRLARSSTPATPSAASVLLTLDAGHFHPTETIADKISSLLLYLDQMLLHVSRGVRWDSDHVVTFNDDLQAIAQEIVRSDALERIHIGLDYFDASINRVAAWAIGARNTLRALLNALLEPRGRLNQLEIEGDFTSRLALQEELKALPAGAVWEYHCLKHGVPVGMAMMDVIKDYERRELAQRG